MSRVSYRVYAQWYGGTMSIASIGARVLSSLRQLGGLSDCMSNWTLGDAGSPVSLSDAEGRMTELVSNNVSRDDDDVPFPEEGYVFRSVGSMLPNDFSGPDTADFFVSVGGKWWNRLEFEVGAFAHPADLSLLTYPLHKGALVAFAENWPCPWALATAFDEAETYPASSRFFTIAWIAYLSAPLARGLIPPRDVLSERTPGGGMILSAVDERLDTANPDHMRRSDTLEAIMNERVGVKAAALDQHAGLPPREGPY